MSDVKVHERDIAGLLGGFFRSFDEKNWASMRACLADEIFADYAAFRGVPACTLAADRYVEQRRSALDALELRHDFFNLHVEVNEGATAAAARCQYVIRRSDPSYRGEGLNYLDSYGHYVFGFVKTGSRWKIARIVQHLQANSGNEAIHPALRNDPTRGAQNEP
jgi:hypothetical protein